MASLRRLYGTPGQSIGRSGPVERHCRTGLCHVDWHFTAYQSVPWLAAVAVTMVLVQAGDALVGRMERDAVKTVGPAATALLNLAALVWMLQ